MTTEKDFPMHSVRMRFTLKGCALIAAIEAGLLPEITQGGEAGYNLELFEDFWKRYNALAANLNDLKKPFYKEGKKRP